MGPPRKGSKRGFEEIYTREVGALSHPTTFTRHFSASEVIVKQINLYRTLVGHQGCVNSVEFNSSGDLLVSGSDDRQVVLWDWVTRSRRMSYPSGHFGNVFQARIMPYTEDRIVTSSADGQVRLGQVSDNGEVHTQKLGKHEGDVYKLAVDPGIPHTLYSCGVDGLVQHFDPRSSSGTKLFYCKSLRDKDKTANNIRLNSIVIDPRNPNYLAVGGADEYARVYDVRKCSDNSIAPVNTFCPRHLMGNKHVHITGLAYSNTSELLVSYIDELIYLFQKNMGFGPAPSPLLPEEWQKRVEPQVYCGHRNSETIKGVSFFGPNDEYVMSGSDCGHIFIWNKWNAKLERAMRGDQHVVNHLEPHPHIPMFASCGIEKTTKLWLPMATDAPPLPFNIGKIMESNGKGREQDSQLMLMSDIVTHVLRLQRRHAAAYAERRYSSAEIESDEDSMVAQILGSSSENTTTEASSTGGSEECIIS